MRVLTATMAQIDNRSQVEKMKIKPKVPQKPIHLQSSKNDTSAKNHRKVSHIHSASAPPVIKEVGHQKYKDFHVKSTSGKSSSLKKIEIRRRSASPVVSSKSFAKVSSRLRLRSSSADSLTTRSWSSCETVCEDDAYVEINLPNVEKGTLIHTDKTSGRLEMVPYIDYQEHSESNIVEKHSSSKNSNLNSSKRPSKTHRHFAMVQELQRNFRSNSLNSLTEIKEYQQDTVDENGYEVPLAFKMPIYLSFDSEELTSFVNQKEPVGLEQDTKKDKPKRKKRLARYKRKVQSSPKLPEELPTPEVSANYFPTEKNNGIVQYEPASKAGDHTRGSRMPKPIDSFLSSRLRVVKSDSNIGNTGSSSLSNQYVISSEYSYYSSSGDDEWASSSDNSCDCDCYYQQIDPPDLPDDTSDHDYEIIEEYMGLPKKPNGADTKKSMKNVVSSLQRKRDKRTKSSDSNKSNSELGVSPKLQRHNIQDIRAVDLTSSTWETVSTPGILKLSDFKHFGRNKLTTGSFPESR